MKSEEIQQKLNKPSEVFSAVKDGELTVYLVYPLTRENELKAYAEKLSQVFKDADNAIEINRETTGLKYNLAITSTNLGTPLFFDELPCLKSCYDDLLQAIKDGVEVKLGFYFYHKKVEPNAKEIAANARRLDDDQAVIEADDPYYQNVDVPIAGSFEVKSDDQTKTEAEFFDLPPGKALLMGALAQEAAREANEAAKEEPADEEADKTQN